MNERGRYDKRNQKGQGGSDPVCTLFHIYCLYGSGSSLFKMAKLGSCGDNLWAFGEYRTSDADRTVQQTGEVILFCYDIKQIILIFISFIIQLFAQSRAMEVVCKRPLQYGVTAVTPYGKRLYIRS